MTPRRTDPVVDADAVLKISLLQVGDGTTTRERPAPGGCLVSAYQGGVDPCTFLTPASVYPILVKTGWRQICWWREEAMTDPFWWDKFGIAYT